MLPGKLLPDKLLLDRLLLDKLLLDTLLITVNRFASAASSMATSCIDFINDIRCDAL